MKILSPVLTGGRMLRQTTMRRLVLMFSVALFALSGTVLVQLGPVSIASAQSKKKDKKANAAAEKRFDEIREEYEAAQDPTEKSQAITKFQRAFCTKTIRYLRGLYKSEKNPGIHMAVTDVLGLFGSDAAMEALLVAGVPVMESDQYTLGSVPRALKKGTLSPEAEKWVLRRGLATAKGLRKYPIVWKEVLYAVASFRSEDRFKVLTSELTKSTTSKEVQIFLLGRLESVKSSKIAAIAKKLARSKSGDVAAAALFCLFEQGGKRYKTDFAKALKSRSWEPRVIALRALHKIGDRKIFDLAVAALDDPQLQVQIAAVRVLTQIGGKGVMDPLIQRLGTAKGRLQDDLADALARLTGRNLGAYAVQWESWWAVNKNKPSQFKALSAKEFSELLAESKAESNTLLYHGLRVVSNYVSFVMDTSHSMTEEYVPIVKGKPKRRTEVVDPNKKKEKSRMEVAQAELKAVLKNLTDGKKFNLVGFDSVIRDFIRDALGLEPDKLTTMSPKTRAGAYTFVDATKAAGQTYMLKALRSAFAYQDLDTIYLLSDGAPTPESGSMKEILEFVARENRLRSVRINAIGFDLKEAEKAFLLQLTDQNYGVFVER